LSRIGTKWRASSALPIPLALEAIGRLLQEKDDLQSKGRAHASREHIPRETTRQLERKKRNAVSQLNWTDS